MNADTELVRVPKLYENMDSGTVGRWQFRVGDSVTTGQALVELITDKTVAELEAPRDGVLLAIFAEERSTVPVGYALAAVGAANADVPDVSADNAARLKAQAQAAGVDIDLGTVAVDTAAPAASPEQSSIRAAPAARRLARAENVDLEAVAARCGTTVVHRKDVEAYLIATRDDGDPGVPEPTLAGRVALITGASGGIGGAVARRLAAAGATVALHAHSQWQKVQGLAAELEQQGLACSCHRADLTDPAACGALVDAVIQAAGHLDILVNNAGSLDDAMVSFMSDAQWEQVRRINLDAPFYLTRAAAMPMARRKWGRIVNIVSDAGRLGAAGRANYAAAKEGLAGFTRSVARELAGSGVRVNAVSPGFIETAMLADLTETRRRDLLRGIPVRRFGAPAEVAELVCFLSTDRADYITGQVISVDGGLFMG